MTLLTKIILVCCLCIVILHVWGALQPSHANWGVHYFAFVNSTVAGLCVGIFLLLISPRIQNTLLGRFERLLHLLSRYPISVSFLIVFGVLCGLIYLFPVRGHLLGDSAILLRSVPRGVSGSDIPPNFRNQPLVFWIYRWVMELYPIGSSPDPASVYYAIDILGAFVYLWLIFWTMRRIERPLVEKVLLGLFLFFGGGSIFFFGYVENYVFQYVMMTAYLITGWFALERRVSIWVPLVLFVVLVLLHLGDLVFLPSAALLVLFRWGKNKLHTALLLAAIAVFGLIASSIIGFRITDLTRHLGSGSVDFLQPFTAIGGNFPYPMFSLVHLVDVMNSQLTIVPCGLFLTIILFMALPSEHRCNNPTMVFLLAAAACGLLFTWLVNSGLGLARDWDLFSSFFLPLMVLPVYFLTQQSTISHRRYVIVVVVLISFLHWVPRIAINADPELHLARVKVLNDPRFLSRSTQLSYDEALANYFFDNGQYRDARVYYEHFLTIDSTNPRIIGNIADVYRKLGDRDKYFRMLKRAVAINSPDPGVYSNLGVEYANRGDTTAAIALNEKAVELNPTMQKAIANLGILYTSRKNYPLADKYFTTAIDLGMRDPLLFRYAGDVCVFLSDYERAVGHYDQYLSLVPLDSRVRHVRDQIYQSLATSRKQ
ncbi:MAG: tetratricopeptide repeat protein [Ignavibacteria bacterium]|nr:tetratricopeptide repeat protein [Ignavibacteria bacterium]